MIEDGRIRLEERSDAPVLVRHWVGSNRSQSVWNEVLHSGKANGSDIVDAGAEYESHSGDVCGLCRGPDRHRTDSVGGAHAVVWAFRAERASQGVGRKRVAANSHEY